MNVRDEELQRLEQYALGLGTKIKYKKHTRGDPGAQWILCQDGSNEIEVFIWPGQSKTKVILNIVHELGHLLAHVYRNRTEDPKTFEAFYQEDKRKKATDPALPKEQRKLIFLAEKADAKYREYVWHEVGIKIPQWKLMLDIDLDIFVYKCYYLTGELPKSGRLRKAKDRWLKKNSK
jgi:hypothetical protein